VRKAQVKLYRRFFVQRSGVQRWERDRANKMSTALWGGTGIDEKKRRMRKSKKGRRPKGRCPENLARIPLQPFCTIQKRPKERKRRSDDNLVSTAVQKKTITDREKSRRATD